MKGKRSRIAGCLGSDALPMQLTGLMEAVKATLIRESQAPSTVVGGWLSNQPAAAASSSLVPSLKHTHIHTHTHNTVSLPR